MQFLMDRDEPRRGLNTENDEAGPDQEVSEESQQKPLQSHLEDEGRDMSPVPSTQSLPSQFTTGSQPNSVNIQKKRKQQTEDPRIQKAFEILESSSKRSRSENKYSGYCQHIGQKLMSYSSRTQTLVEHEINTVLFRTDMGYYDRLSTVAALLPPYPVTTLSTTPQHPHYTFTTSSTPAPYPQYTTLTTNTPL
ncbi:uncharacterized protein LOC126750464 isoform X2 [Anthonomus grandis grandis]|nr:uncharacterized protein LOC126750464 isoform X2 [Anthonomus grandis grandis]